MMPSKRFYKLNISKKIILSSLVILSSVIFSGCDFLKLKKASKQRQNDLQDRLDSLKIENDQIMQDYETVQRELERRRLVDSTGGILYDSLNNAD